MCSRSRLLLIYLLWLSQFLLIDAFNSGLALNHNKYQYHRINNRYRHNSGSSSHTSLYDNQLKSAEVYATELWVERVVIGKELCPWALGVFQPGKLKITQPMKKENGSFDSGSISTSEYADDQIIEFIINEAIELLNIRNSNNTAATTTNTPYLSTLIVLPSYTKFQPFLQLVDDIETYFEECELTEFIQVATFHPFYKFENTTSKDVENYTNRSPYAIIHLLRVSDVTAAVDQYKGQTHVIYEKNIETMKTVGLTGMKQMLKEIVSDANNVIPHSIS